MEFEAKTMDFNPTCLKKPQNIGILRRKRANFRKNQLSPRSYRAENKKSKSENPVGPKNHHKKVKLKRPTGFSGVKVVEKNRCEEGLGSKTPVYGGI